MKDCKAQGLTYLGPVDTLKSSLENLVIAGPKCLSIATCRVFHCTDAGRSMSPRKRIFLALKSISSNLGDKGSMGKGFSIIIA